MNLTSFYLLGNYGAVPDTIVCDTHGERQQTYVCVHLSGGTSGLGFNSADQTPENSLPDAWCDDCEIIRKAHGGWNQESEKLLKVVLLCSECYRRSRIRNTHTSVKLDDLAGLRWKCTSCEEWHTGPLLDLTYDSPHYWTSEHQRENDRSELLPSWRTERPKTFLSKDYCVINYKDFFARGIIALPIIGTSETLRWGVWGSLSRENFEKMLETQVDPKRVELPPMFSWLSTQISEYPDTLNLKMYAHIRDVDSCPDFELELTDHPLALEFHHGISPARLREITVRRLGQLESDEQAN